MNKIWIIIQREYVTRVRKKSFLITTLLAPVGFIALMVSTVALSSYSTSDKHVAIVDESGIFDKVVFPDAPDGSIIFHREKELKALEEDLKKEKPRYDAIIEIPKFYELENPRKVTINYLSSKSVGGMSRSFINKTFTDKIRALRTASLHLNQAQLDDLNQEVKLDYLRVNESSKNSAGSTAGAVLGYVLGFAIYMTLIIYGTMIMKGVVEEKSSRIMEVLVSSVKPIQLMMAKIIGIGAVGLTQFFLWGVLLFLTNIFLLPLIGIKTAHGPMLSQPEIHNNMDADELQQLFSGLADIHFGPVLIIFFIFFLGGFLIYGSLFAAIGAAGGDETDSQSLTFPILLPIIISIIILMNILGQPEGNLAFWASIIPFSSPIIMPALMPFGPPWWQVALSIAMLIGGFIFCAWIAAKIYRTGILMYGKKTTFREMARWVFARRS